MNKILEVPSRIYVNAQEAASIPAAISTQVDVRREEARGDVEYTNIATLWRKPCDYPKEFPCVLLCRYTYYRDKEDIYLTTDIERFVSEHDFMMNFKEVKNAVCWCELNDILPKGGESNE